MSVSTSLNRLGRNKKQNTYGYKSVGTRSIPGQVTVYRPNKNDGFLVDYLHNCKCVFKNSIIDINFVVDNTTTEYIFNCVFGIYSTTITGVNISNASCLKSIMESRILIQYDIDGRVPIRDCPFLHTLECIELDTIGGTIFVNCPSLRNVKFRLYGPLMDPWDLSGAPLSYESLLSFIYVLSNAGAESYTITFYDGELTADQITDITQKIEAKGYVSSPTSTLLTS